VIKLGSLGSIGRERAVWISEDGSRFADAGVDSWCTALKSGTFDQLLAAAPEPTREVWRPLAGERLGPPLPEPSKIVAVGLNYLDHAREQNKKPPEEPLLFAKAPTCLIGTGDAIRLPPQEERADAEAELMVVIGRRAHGIGPEAAAGVILGYTVFNDVSGRDAQYGDRQWFRGKSFDTFGPCGPWIVLAAEIGDPHALQIRAFWNDTLMQESTTGNLIHGVYDLVSYISRQMTLLPGDLIATGTPAGVGVFREPPVFLKPGDRVRIEIERIGAIENPVSEAVETELG
jgi:acylpyruvate hydrolase